MRRTKIVCTLGPATHSRDAIKELIRAGMDVARLNFSHGTHREHAESARWVREASKELGRPVALLQDLCGPKIRTGRTHDRRAVTLRAGQRLLLTSRNVPGSSRRISISYAGLARNFYISLDISIYHRQSLYIFFYFYRLDLFRRFFLISQKCI